ncbi:toxin RelE4 [mine drainage metagenome]|uniref:Toxin RelE4 n=1 Tax=mine drainage metagenome TaxID=410659 RepID=A0A1J5Q8G2_9ZZZZ
MHSLVWKKQALADLLKIVQHIAQDNPDAAEALADDIEAKVGKLREFPEMYNPGRKRGTRELVAHENYIVVYRVTVKRVDVLRVKHAAQQWP